MCFCVAEKGKASENVHVSKLHFIRYTLGSIMLDPLLRSGGGHLRFLT